MIYGVVVLKFSYFCHMAFAWYEFLSCSVSTPILQYLKNSMTQIREVNTLYYYFLNEVANREKKKLAKMSFSQFQFPILVEFVNTLYDLCYQQDVNFRDKQPVQNERPKNKSHLRCLVGHSTRQLLKNEYRMSNSQIK